MILSNRLSIQLSSVILLLLFLRNYSSKDLNARKINAGNIVKEVAKLVGGNGGGRPDIASAGGKDLSKVDFALEKAEEILKAQF